MKKLLGVICCVCLTMAPPALGQDLKAVRAGDLLMTDAVVRVGLEGRTTAGYMTIRNEGDGADRLTGASSSAAERVEIHSSNMVDGVMRMRPLAEIEIPADGSTVFAPGGNHLMLIGLEAPLAVGATVELTLTFDRAGEVLVPAQVVGMQAPIPNASSVGDAEGHAAH